MLVLKNIHKGLKIIIQNQTRKTLVFPELIQYEQHKVKHCIYEGFSCFITGYEELYNLMYKFLFYHFKMLHHLMFLFV